jgi:hypothetical protein
MGNDPSASEILEYSNFGGRNLRIILSLPPHRYTLYNKYAAGLNGHCFLGNNVS